MTEDFWGGGGKPPPPLAQRSLPRVAKPAPFVSNASRFKSEAIVEAMASLSAEQKLNRETHAVHAAGFWTPGRGLVAVREDVGRHNALDSHASGRRVALWSERPCEVHRDRPVRRSTLRRR
jgi:hypothetical protein